ncbi:hypothetical protein LZ31DRAFT_24756 [Colletotrichum somersetense]|nr:hypothetical protein LZ31DRAFT_24756 [Colletotrichum somersetense]
MYVTSGNKSFVRLVKQNTASTTSFVAMGTRRTSAGNRGGGEGQEPRSRRASGGCVIRREGRDRTLAKTRTRVDRLLIDREAVARRRLKSPAHQTAYAVMRQPPALTCLWPPNGLLTRRALSRQSLWVCGPAWASKDFRTRGEKNHKMDPTNIQ